MQNQWFDDSQAFNYQLLASSNLVPSEKPCYSALMLDLLRAPADFVLGFLGVLPEPLRFFASIALLVLVVTKWRAAWHFVSRPFRLTYRHISSRIRSARYRRQEQARQLALQLKAQKEAADEQRRIEELNRMLDDI